MFTVLPRAAEAALRAAIEEGASIWDLEFVDVDERTLSILDDAGVVLLAQLIALTEEEILGIAYIGEGGLQSLVQGLCEFHLVAPLKAKAESDLQRSIAAYDKENRFGSSKNGNTAFLNLR